MIPSSPAQLKREIKKKWKPRKAQSHKGDYGRVFVIAGARGFTGAALLAAEGALRAGAGLITLGVPDSIYSIVARRTLEIMVRDYPSVQGGLAYSAYRSLIKFTKTQSVVALGPGLGGSPQTQKLIRHFAMKMDKPLILDADGLNAFEGHKKMLKALRGRAILTPHPGEFKRLFGSKVSSRSSERIQQAQKAARQYGVWIILKGDQSVIALPSGKVFLNPSGNPGMASGGTGDVLTGILAGLLAQGFSFDEAARFGTFLHGLAGDRAKQIAGEASMTAGDLLSALPAVIKKTRGV